MSFAVRRFLGFAMLLGLHLFALILIAGFLLHGTVPPEVHPERIGWVREANAKLIAAISFAAGLSCYWSIQRCLRSIEK